MKNRKVPRIFWCLAIFLLPDAYFLGEIVRVGKRCAYFLFLKLGNNNFVVKINVYTNFPGRSINFSNLFSTTFHSNAYSLYFIKKRRNHLSDFKK